MFVAGVGCDRCLRRLKFATSRVSRPVVPSLRRLGHLRLARLARFPFRDLAALMSQPISLRSHSVCSGLVRHHTNKCYCRLGNLFLTLLHRLNCRTEVVAKMIAVSGRLRERGTHARVTVVIDVSNRGCLISINCNNLIPDTPLLFACGRRSAGRGSVGRGGGSDRGTSRVRAAPRNHCGVVGSSDFRGRVRGPVLPRTRMGCRHCLLYYRIGSR